ncbi:MAG: MMPL family transporter [Deltaproteobacteria bacterium]|nr:MMPL family transporter [Deltaproteobacteria bacterium]
MQDASDNRPPNRDYIERLSDAFERIGGWSYDHRWWVLLGGILIFVTSGMCASRAHVDMTFASFFEESDPTYSAYQKFRAEFGSDETAYILYEAPESEFGPFNIEVMRKIRHLTQALEEEVPFLSEITSLTNVEYMEGLPDGIRIYGLLDDFPENQDALLEIRENVLKRPLYVGGLVSQDARYAAVILEMSGSAVDPPEDLKLDPEGSDWIENFYPQVSETAIAEILARPEYEGITFYHSGEVPWNSTYNRIMIPQTLMLTVLTYFVIGALLFFFFRRWMGVFGPFIIVTISITISAGLIGIMGWKLDLTFPFVPNLLIAIGVADSVHVISEFNNYYHKLGDRREAIRRTMYLVGTPCLLTSLTTAGGLLAMSISDIKSMAHLAVYSATGIMAAFFLTVTLLMALFAFGRRDFVPKGKSSEEYRAREGRAFDRILGAVVRFDIRHTKAILVFFAVVFAVSFAGMARLVVDTSFIDQWREDAQVRQTALKVDYIMGGMNSIIYIFDTGEADGIKDPAVLREIERVQSKAHEEGAFVRKSYSIVDVIKELNRTFHEDDPAYYKIPETRELVAQLLLVYEISGGEDLEKYVSGDFSRATLEMRCQVGPISVMQKLADNIDAYLDEEPLQSSEVQITGVGALWLKFASYITTSQIQGMLLAFCIIAAMLCFIFRSVKMGLLSMIPNLSPVFFTLGYMGWAGIDLDYTRLLIAPLAIGIAVDDTIHLVTRYHMEFRRCGDYAKALEDCLLNVGRALIGTTVILVMGFIMNVFHGMETQVVFGKLIAWTIFSALIADFFLMPALILLLKPFGPEKAAAS